MRTCVLAGALLCVLSLADGSDRMQEENKKDIEELARILRETVKVDLEALSAKHNKLVEEVEKMFDNSLKYVDKLAEEVTTHLENRLDELDKNTRVPSYTLDGHYFGDSEIYYQFIQVYKY